MVQGSESREVPLKSTFAENIVAGNLDYLKKAITAIKIWVRSSPVFNMASACANSVKRSPKLPDNNSETSPLYANPMYLNKYVAISPSDHNHVLAYGCEYVEVFKSAQDALKNDKSRSLPIIGYVSNEHNNIS